MRLTLYRVTLLVKIILFICNKALVNRARAVKVMLLLGPALSIGAGIGLSRLYLSQNALQFRGQFETQNHLELNAGDSFQISRRLEALSGSPEWVCISGKKGGTVFFEKKAASCAPDIFSTSVSVYGQAGSGIEIDFTLTLPTALYWSMVAFLSIQVSLVVLIAWSGRLYERRLLESQTDLGKLAAEVAHDIRSPLSALEVGLTEAQLRSADSEILIRSAISRIRQIANTLIEQHRRSIQQTNIEPETNLSAILLSEILDEIVSEKLTELRSHIGISISCDFAVTTRSTFVNVDMFRLKRVISNLINNAVESYDDQGSVELFATRKRDMASIVIKDTGRGIPSAVMRKIGRRGFSLSKNGGSGLGLVQAFTQVKSWGGKLSLKSEPKRGTEVEILIPITQSPPWHFEEIEIRNKSTILVLDDDPNIGQAWRSKFATELPEFDQTQIHLFSSVEKFADWALENLENSPNPLILIDQELGSRVSGLQLLQQLKLEKSGIIVSSSSIHSDVRLQCAHHAIRFLPKANIAQIVLRSVR